MTKITRHTTPEPKPKNEWVDSAVWSAFFLVVVGFFVWASRLPPPEARPEPTKEEVWAERNGYRACLINYEGEGFVTAGRYCAHMKPDGADTREIWEARHTDRDNVIGYEN